MSRCMISRRRCTRLFSKALAALAAVQVLVWLVKAPPRAPLSAPPPPRTAAPTPQPTTSAPTSNPFKRPDPTTSHAWLTHVLEEKIGEPGLVSFKRGAYTQVNKCATARPLSLKVDSAQDFGAQLDVHQCVHVIRRSDLIDRDLAHNRDWVNASAANFAMMDKKVAWLLNHNHRLEYKMLSVASTNRDPGAAWLTSEYAKKHALGSGPWGWKMGYEPMPSVAVFHNVQLSRYGELATPAFSLQIKSCKPQMTRYRAPPDGMEVHDTVAVIAAPFFAVHQDYFHFVCERLLRVALVIDLLRARPDIKVQVAYTSRPYVQAAFELLGIDRSRLITGKAYAKLAFFPEPAACGKPPYALLQLGRRMLLHALWPKGAPKLPPKPIMLVMKRESKASGGRSIDNFQELLDALKRTQGQYEVRTHTGAEPWAEQLRAFSQASVVIGPHGAGMSNTVVCAPGTLILEFHPVNEVNVCFMAMAAKLGLQYRCQVSGHHKSIDPRGEDAFMMHIDVAKALALINSTVT